FEVESNETVQLTVGGQTATGTITDNDLRVASVKDSTAEEGKNLSFEVTLTGKTPYETEIKLELKPGTASAGDDYTLTPVFSDPRISYDQDTGMVKLPAGIDSFTVSYVTENDVLVEKNETVQIILDGHTATGTIIDNDLRIESVENAVAEEGDDLTFQVKLNGEAAYATEFDFVLKAVTATEDSDYAVVPTFSHGVTYSDGKITVPVGVDSFTVSYETKDDFEVESNETVQLTVGGQTATGTITDNDLRVASVKDSTAEEGKNLSFEVTLNGAAKQATEFDFKLEDITAKEGSDYAVVPTFSNGVTYSDGKITVPAGVESFTVSYVTENDVLVEKNETVQIILDGHTATGTIIDNDLRIESVENAVAEEGDDLTFQVKLNGEAPYATEFDFVLKAVTATEGSDYAVVPKFTNGVTYSDGKITVPVGVDSFTVSYETKDDFEVESNETVQLTVGGQTATGTITDNDVVVESVKGSTAVEGKDVSFTVTLSGETPHDTTFDLVLKPGSTTSEDFESTPVFSHPGITYDATTGKVTVPEGIDSFTVTYPTVDDSVVEIDETVQFTIGGKTATGTIIDNDVVVESVEGSTAVEGKDVSFTVTLSGETPHDTTFDLVLKPGSTTSEDFESTPVFSHPGITYDATTGKVTVPEGIDSFTVTYPTVDDSVVEIDETVQFTIGGKTATGTITDNDVVVESVVGSTTVEGLGLKFDVALSSKTPHDTTFDLALTPGSATSGDYTNTPVFSDPTIEYDATTGKVTVPAGIDSFTVTYPTVDDS
ncbi:hypothetical protein G9F31_15495, partial [Acinetobacter sp. 187]|uniref:Calx-beta domain-containing protein n=1 Tax=Acinetobacter lanii TaxID=2715163 RepID=UPI0018C8A190